jgi:Protein of unknown function (DUF2721)
MTEIARLFQAFLAPAIFVSATALLILSINVRLMGIVSRLRQYVHAKHDAAKNNRAQEAEAYTAQINSIEQRAEMIRRCFLFALISLVGTIASCLLLGIGLYRTRAAVAAVVVFVMAMICLLAATVHYIREVLVALSSVRNEANDSRFMDLGAPQRFGHTIRSKWPCDSKSFGCNAIPLFFNIEVNLRYGAVFDYLLAIQFHL